jgi:tetratricopeptide (TPR) repeat protein
LANEVIKKDNKHYKSYNIKGVALAYNGSFEEGMKNIDKALEINPSYGYARFNKALTYELYGKYEEALKWYDKDLEVENYIWSYYGKASIYGRKGDVENTVKYLKIAIEMDKVVKEEARTERDFDNVRQSKEFQELTK